jgi:hypothetical protein
MSTTTVRWRDFASGFPDTTQETRIYLRKKWTDDWDREQFLEPQEATWSVAPVMPTAAFVWDYGRIRQVGQDAFATVEKQDLHGQFVKIEADCQDGKTREWIGRLDVEADTMHGDLKRIKSAEPGEEEHDADTEIISSGRQVWYAFGLETLLTEHEILDARFVYPGETIIRQTRVPLTFNENGRGNRSPSKVSGTYVFDPSTETAEFWSTRDIVEYLLRWGTPVNRNDKREITFDIETADLDRLPAWDKPELRTDRQTTGSLLQRLIDRRRMLLWYLEVADAIMLRVKSFAKEKIPVDLPDADPIPEASEKRNLIFERDPLTSASIKTATVEKVDQTIVVGSPIRGVGTFSIADGTLEEGWPDSLFLPYSSGALFDTTYPSMNRRDRERRNAEERARPLYEHIFTRFVLPADWNGQVKDGEDPAGSHDLWPEASLFRSFSPSIMFESSLPLAAGVEYAEDAIKNGDVSAAERRENELDPLVFLQRSDDKWRTASALGTTGAIEELDEDAPNELQLSCHVFTRERALHVKPTNFPPHILASDGEFTPLDEDTVVPAFDVTTKMKATLSLAGERVRGQWPKKAPASVAYVRYKMIDAGDAHQLVVVAPGTVVGIDKDGDLQRSTGGHLPPEDSDEYPVKQLTAIARIAHGWYGEKHQVLTVQSQRIKSQDEIERGDLITDVAEEDSGHRTIINGPVTEISMTWPVKPPIRSDQLPMQKITTWAGELDPLQAPLKPIKSSAPAPHGHSFADDYRGRMAT